MVRDLLALAVFCLLIAVPGVAYSQAPTAAFIASKTAGCSPVVVQFTNQSTGGATSWSWDLGNGGNSTLQNPSATYITPGTYAVILTATNANGSTKDTNYITVYTSPTVSFTASDTTTVCGSKTVTFNNTTVPGAAGAVTYLWDFGDGNTSSATSPTHTYTYAGNFAVSLVVVNSSGCTNTLTKGNYIKIIGKPTASFAANQTSGCNTPFQVIFSNTSTNASTHAWSFGDGNTSTASNPTHTYTNPGTYTVRLIVTGSNGCKDTLIRTSYIAVGQVVANFTTNTPLCAGKPVQFTNTTTPGIGPNRTWYFNSSATSTAVNPTYTYTVPGTYNVTLVEKYDNNCIDTVTKSITVSGNPDAQFVTPDTVGCALPFTVNFTNNSTGATSYLWAFGAGGTSTATNPSHAYTSNWGPHAVTLTATNAAGCQSTLTKATYIKLVVPVATLTTLPTGACINQSIKFTGGMTAPLYATNYRWDFGDGSSIVNCASCSTQTHSYSSTGTYTVKLIVSTSSSCTDTVTQVINISTKPTAGFTASPLSICPNGTTNFTNTSTGALTYFWQFGDGFTATTTTPNHTYDNTDKYNVTLIASNNGCNDTLTRNQYIDVKLPRAEFKPTFQCSTRLKYSFEDKSLGANTYLWEFGDGNTSTSAGNVTHTYSAAGVYNVVQRITNTATGCTDTFAYLINAQPITLPTMTANDTTICRGNLLLVTRTGPSYYTYATYFGTSLNSGQVPALGWYANTPGTFDVKIVVTDTFGCKDSVVKTNYIKVGGMTVNFAASSLTPCKEDKIIFDDNTPVTTFPIASRFWYFGDGQQDPSATDTIHHRYNNGGPYNIKLVVTDNNGCKDSLTKDNYIYVYKPVAQFHTNDTSACAGSTVQFANSSGGASFTSAWSFGDGNNSGATSPAHIYNALGTYTVKLVLTDMYGCKDSAVKTNYIKVQKPTAAFTLSDTLAACPPLTIQAANASTGAVSYSWTFGNNNQASLPNPSITYTYPGIYTVKLIATNSGGCKDSATRTVKLNGPTGTYNYTPLAGCNPLTVQFTATSSNTSQFIWDMNNGVTQTTGTPSFSYTFTQPGRYVPKLVLSDGVSCLVPIQNNDTLRVDNVNADFSFTTAGNLCNKDTVYFNDTIKSENSAIATRSWEFGDGNNSTAQDPKHFYAAPGTYQVRLIVGNVTGCKDTVIKTIVVRGLPNVDITAAGDSLCPGQATGIQLTATGAVTYSWTPTTALSCTGCANPVANPQAHTKYIVTGTDGNGCSAKDSITIGIKAKPVVAVNNDTAICTGASVTLKATGAASYIWSPATGLTCTNCANPVATPTGNNTYTVIGTNISGCKDTAAIIVTVLTKPDITTNGSVSICNGDSAMITASGATTYTWSPATNLSCTGCANPYAKPSATTTYTVVGALANGCKDTATATVNVNGLPTVSAGNNMAICNGASTPLQATGAATYAWSPATGLSCTNCANPTANPIITTTYRVIGANGNSCKDTATVTVTVNALPNVSAGADKAVCAGLGVALQATGATSYVWTPATSLSCTNCANPTATPSATTTYTVTGTDANSCKDTGVVKVNVNALPTVSAGTDKNICSGDSVLLTGTGATSYAWTPVTGLSCANCVSPKASPAATTTYTVTGTDGNGCKNTATVKVSVNAPPNVSAGNNTAICNGSSTTLNATGAATYTWSPATGLSCTNCASPTANPTTTTTYTVIGANGSSCKDTATIIVTVNAIPNVSAGADKAVCAGSGVALQATGATSYIWTPATGLSCANCANPTATPSATTTYTVTGTDANGCKDTGVVKVNVNVLPIVGAGTDKDICPGDSVLLTGSGATSYAWTPSTGLSCTNCVSPKASPAVTTTYTIIGTDGNGCKNTATVKVSVNAPPNVSAGNNTAICNGSSTVLQATGAASYTWSPSTGLSCTNCASPTANPTTTTTYTVIGANGSSCKDTATVTVTVNALPTVSAGNDVAVCAGSGTTLQATGATSYVWTPSTGLSCANCANPTAIPAITTTYTVTGTDANGCKDTGVVKVNVNALPIVGAGSNATICLKDSTQLQATGAATYTWAPATGLSCTNCANPKASPAGTTTYTVTGTDANGCKNTSTVTVTVNALPVIAATNQAICNGSNVQLQATGGVSYIWTPSTGLSCTNCPDPVASPTTTTTYTITGTDGNGCKNNGQVTVTVNPLPNVSAGTNESICLKDSAQLQASGATSYIWTPATGLSCANCANPKASPAVTTVYTVTGTDANGCKNTSTVTITIKALPVVNAGNDVAVCAGSGTTLNATGADTYTWTPPAGLSCTNCQSPVATPAITTKYIVTGTGANSCKAKDTVEVKVNALPVVSAGNNSDICAEDSVKLTATGAASYVWTPSTGLSCTACPDPMASPSATTIYIVTGTDNNGCKDTGKVTVTVKPLPVVIASAARTLICGKDTTQLTATGATSYSWAPALGLSCTNCANPIATPPAAITYIVTGTTAGCTDTAHVNINLRPMPNVNAGPDKAYCNGGSDSLSASGAISYAWSPASGLSCTTCDHPEVKATATTVYTLTGTDADGCTNTDNVTVTVHALPNVNAGPDKDVCEGGTVQLLVTGASSYTWSPAEGLSCANCANPLASTASETVFSVTGTDANGCVNTDEVKVTAILKKPLSYSKDDSICIGEEISLFASGGTSYSWSPDGGLQDPAAASIRVAPTGNTTYSVIIKQGTCFTDTARIKVYVFQLPEIDAGEDMEVRGGTETRLEPRANNVVKYEWSPAETMDCSDCRNPVVSPTKTTVYHVKATSEHGCVAEDDITIKVTCGTDQLFIANTFTPNNDGVNDMFYPQGRGLNEIQRFSVYSRWGELLFDKQNMPLNNPTYGWNGTYKSEPLKPDVFVYIIRATCEDGKPIEIKGDISLIR